MRPIMTKFAKREEQYIPVYFGADCAQRSVDEGHEA